MEACKISADVQVTITKNRDECFPRTVAKGCEAFKLTGRAVLD